MPCVLYSTYPPMKRRLGLRWTLCGHQHDSMSCSITFSFSMTLGRKVFPKQQSTVVLAHGRTAVIIVHCKVLYVV